MEAGEMDKDSDIIPLSDLKQDADHAFRRVRSSKRALYITKRGHPKAVMMSVETYEKSQRERAILELLARGERQIRTGKGHDLNDVLAEADRRLGRQQD